MCYAVKCTKCGKSTWAGCGRHVAAVYRDIPTGEHCLCRQWPGVNRDGDGDGDGDVSSSVSKEQPSTVFSCSIL